MIAPEPDRIRRRCPSRIRRRRPGCHPWPPGALAGLRGRRRCRDSGSHRIRCSGVPAPGDCRGCRELPRRPPPTESSPPTSSSCCSWPGTGRTGTGSWEQCGGERPGGGDGEGPGARRVRPRPPAVLVHLPVFHERQVVERLIGAVAALEPATASSRRPAQRLHRRYRGHRREGPAGRRAPTGSPLTLWRRPGLVQGRGTAGPDAPEDGRRREPCRRRPTPRPRPPWLSSTPTSRAARTFRGDGARAARRPGARPGPGAPGAPGLTARCSPRGRNPARWAAPLSEAGARLGYAVRQGSYPIRHRPGREGCLASPR